MSYKNKKKNKTSISNQFVLFEQKTILMSHNVKPVPRKSISICIEKNIADASKRSE